MPDWMEDLAVDVQVLLNAPITLLRANVNIYFDGSQALACHADDEPILGKHPYIASFSLGSSRLFSFKPKTGGPFYKVLLDHGDLLTMSGPTQEEYLHSVWKCKGTTQVRINVTFRFTAQHAPHCPLRAHCFRSFGHREDHTDGGPSDFFGIWPFPLKFILHSAFPIYV